LLAAGCARQSSPPQGAATGDTGVSDSGASSETYSVIARGADTKVWQRVSSRTDAFGKTTAVTNRYTELATGMHFLKNGQWFESSESIEVQLGGGAIAQNGPYQVYFPGDIYNDAFQLTTSDSKALVSRPLGLAFADDQRSELIAELKPGSAGQILPSGNQILYSDICTDCRLDLLTTYKKSGYESDVVIRTQLPDPVDYGFSNQVRLQWWTEFLSAPVPEKTRQQLPVGTDDAILSFGDMKMVTGKAFLIGKPETGLKRTRVTKQWLVIGGRTFLVEEIPLSNIAPQLEKLPLRTAAIPPKAPSGTVLPQMASHPALPASRIARHTDRAVSVASTADMQPGFAIDYTLSGGFTNFTFQSDTTYVLLSNSVVQLHGTTKFEGGTVIKMTSNSTNTPTMYLYGSINFLSDAYRPVVFTSTDDDSVGDHVAGSSGVPIQGNAFCIDAEGPGVSGKDWVFKNARVSYAYAGFVPYDGLDVTVQDCQFVNCVYPVAVPESGNLMVRNALFVGCSYPLYTEHYGSAENVTAIGYTNFCQSSEGLLGLALTNCIVVSTGAWVGEDLFVTNPPAPVLDHTTVASAAIGLFQQAGGGGFYLAPGSTNRDSGTSTINSNLLAELRGKTTYPPIIQAGGVLSSVDITLSPQAQRDIDLIDRGYHYDPLDFCFGAVLVTNAININILPGTAIAAFGTGGTGWGLNITDGAHVICHGDALNLVHITEFTTVQEQTNSGWRMPDYALIVDDGGVTGATFDVRFVECSCFSQDTSLIGFTVSPSSVRDCQFYGGYFVSYASIGLTNNLFYRVATVVDPFDSSVPVVRNNLFYQGYFEFAPTVTNGIVKDNLIDRANISFYPSAYNGGHNAFVTNHDRFIPSFTNDIILTNTDYQVGPLGQFYYPTNGSMLSRLINSGSTNANLVALYQETVMTNLVSGLEIKETNSIVDIGFHYVAVDSSGSPIDTNGDGVPDYIEDANGNGQVDSGEIGWNIVGDLGLKVLITRPKAGSAIP